MYMHRVCTNSSSTRRADSLSQTSRASRALSTASSTAGGSSLLASVSLVVRLRGCEAVGKAVVTWLGVWAPRGHLTSVEAGW